MAFKLDFGIECFSVALEFRVQWIFRTSKMFNWNANLFHRRSSRESSIKIESLVWPKTTNQPSNFKTQIFHLFLVLISFKLIFLLINALMYDIVYKSFCFPEFHTKRVFTFGRKVSCQGSEAKFSNCQSNSPKICLKLIKTRPTSICFPAEIGLNNNAPSESGPVVDRHRRNCAADHNLRPRCGESPL